MTRTRIVWLIILALWGGSAAGNETPSHPLKRDYPAGSYAYAHYSAGLGKGSATLTQCPSPVLVGSELEQVVLRYQASQGPIAPGGRVLVTFPADCSAPRLEDGATTSALTVTAAVPTSVSALMVYFSRVNSGYLSAEHRRQVQVALPEGLPAGGEITFTWRKAQVSRFARGWTGGQLLFQVYVDEDADGYEEEIANSPWAPVMTRAAHTLAPVVQSTAVVGEPVRLVVYAMDQFQNPALAYRGQVRIETDDPQATLPAPYRFDGYDASSHEFTLTFATPGYHWVKVMDEAGGLAAESNPVEVLASPPKQRLYWGDLHVHTRMSADAAAWVPSPVDYRESYLVGRHRAGLDFMANADHHNLEQGNYAPHHWAMMQRVTNEMNDPGRFMTLVGLEFSNATGDQNIYTAGDRMPYFRLGKDHPHDLWRQFKGTDFLPIPHHFAQSMRPWDWKNFDPKLITVAEIFSTHGRGEFHGNKPHFSHHKQPTLKGATWRDQLKVGRQIGAMASSDEHWGRPGASGLVAVWATALERQPVLEQIRARHCYASSNARAILHFTVNGAEMGEQITASTAPVLKLRGATPSQITEIAIVKNGVEIPLGREIATAGQQGQSAERTFNLTWTDPDFTGDAYYYVRVTMAGPLPNTHGQAQELVWSSPVWVKQSLGVNGK